MVEGMKMFGGAYTSDDLKKMIAALAVQVADRDATITALKAEVERLSTPTTYFLYSDGHREDWDFVSSIEEILPSDRMMGVHKIIHYHKFEPIYVVWETKNKYVKFSSIKEAEAFAKSLKVAG